MVSRCFNYVYLRNEGWHASWRRVTLLRHQKIQIDRLIHQRTTVFQSLKTCVPWTKQRLEKIEDIQSRQESDPACCPVFWDTTDTSHSKTRHLTYRGVSLILRTSNIQGSNLDTLQQTLVHTNGKRSRV